MLDPNDPNATLDAWGAQRKAGGPYGNPGVQQADPTGMNMQMNQSNMAQNQQQASQTGGDIMSLLGGSGGGGQSSGGGNSGSGLSSILSLLALL